MAPSAVLVKSLTTHPIMRSFSFDQISFFVNISFASSYHFGVYSQTTVGASDIFIRALVIVAIITTPYLKFLIVKVFLSEPTPCKKLSVSISDLITTVSTYFDMSPIVGERNFLC